MKELISIIRSIPANINYIIVIVLNVLSLYFIYNVVIQDEDIEKWHFIIIFLSQISLIFFFYRRKKLAEEQEKRTIFTYYAYNIFLDLTKSRYELEELRRNGHIINCFSYILFDTDPWYSKKEFVYAPPLDAPNYLNKFRQYAQRHKYSSFYDYYIRDSRKNVQLAAYLFLFDALLVSYHYANVSQPIEERDGLFFDLLAENIGYCDGELDIYKDTFCLRETRKELAKRLSNRWTDLE